ncbi:DNA repair protein RecO [Shouchella shacheensis]|uniref:DNA repair protein RecO n=1 Tax=Shouchella shacheensis TaxID=1649580 RepID=UPI00073FDC5F|nr:DNA repair protein RecO [Shouchella shacheensis]
MLKKVEAVVLKTIDYGETNKVITLYTKEAGKVAVIAKGAKKPSSRFSAITQPFVYGTFLYYQGQGLGSLSQGEAIASFKLLQSDVLVSAYASYIVELVEKLTEEKKVYMFLFDWLVLSLRQLNDGIDPEVLARIMDMKMLTIAGAKPELDCCASCKSTERDPVAFSISFAGFLCTRCRAEDERAYPVSLQLAKLLRLFYYVEIQRLGRISVKPETKNKVKTIIHHYYDDYVGVQLKTRRFLEQIEKLDANAFRLDK